MLISDSDDNCTEMEQTLMILDLLMIFCKQRLVSCSQAMHTLHATELSNLGSMQTARNSFVCMHEQAPPATAAGLLGSMWKRNMQTCICI